MENQNTSLQIIDFSPLPKLFQENQGLRDRTLLAVSAKIEQLNAVQLTSLEVLAGDKLEQEVNDLRSKVAESEKYSRERRMYYTKQFDVIKSAFTTMEKDILTAGTHLKRFCDAWNAEKARRQAEQDRQNELKIAHDNALADFSAHVSKEIYLRHNLSLKESLDKMSNTFYAKRINDIEAYGQTLREWTPQAPAIMYSYMPSNRLTQEEENKLRAQAEAMLFPELAKQWCEKMTAERDRLVELIPSRILELQRIQNDATEAAKEAARIEEERKQREADLAKEAAEQQAAAELTASTDKLNNMLVQAALAPAAQLSKGASRKFKYDPASHKEFVPIINYWATKCMALLTIDEVKKKLSFMITAANKELAKGTRIEGVTTVEDFSTRTSRKKKTDDE